MSNASTHPEAIPDCPDAFRTKVGLQLRKHSPDNGLDALWQMTWRALEPAHEIKVRGAIQRDWIAVEQVGHDDEVAIGRQLVGDELGVREAVADDISEEQDGALGRAVRGTRHVGLDCDGEQSVRARAWSGGDVPPPICWNWPWVSPWCLTPTVQQAAGGFEAMASQLRILSRRRMSGVKDIQTRGIGVRDLTQSMDVDDQVEPYSGQTRIELILLDVNVNWSFHRY